jgi:hypothetical protein
MSIMTSQSTRLELTIVAAVLLVLFLCRQPPQPGTAGVRTNIGQSTSDEGQGTGQSPVGYGPSALGHPQLPTVPPSAANPSVGRATPDNATMDLAAPPRPKTKRIGVVDARNCPGLNYKDLMYGEVTARWVWDGGRSVLRKVIEVREANGAISTWDFAEQNGAILTELDP